MADALAPPHAGYRPMPRDFAETFVRVGWDGIEAEARAHKTTIVRWIEAYDAEAIAEGRPVLNQLRRTHLEAIYAARGHRVFGRKPGQSRAARYVMGRTRKPKWPCRAPRFWDVGLVPPVEGSAPDRPQQRRLSAIAAVRIIESGAKQIEASADFLAGMAKAAELIRAEMMEDLR